MVIYPSSFLCTFTNTIPIKFCKVLAVKKIKKFSKGGFSTDVCKIFQDGEHAYDNVDTGCLYRVVPTLL